MTEQHTKEALLGLYAHSGDSSYYWAVTALVYALMLIANAIREHH